MALDTSNAQPEPLGPNMATILALSKHAGRTYRTGDVDQLIEAIEALDTSELAESAARAAIETSLNAKVMSKACRGM